MSSSSSIVMSMEISNRPESPHAIRSAIVLGLIAHQVFRKFETYNVAINAALLFLPPVLLSVLNSPTRWTLFSTLFTTTATYIATMMLSVVAYRLSPLHPLAKYPGPIVCRVSKFWMAFLSIPGFQHKYIKSLHDRYGDVVRTGPNEVSIRNSTVLGTLLGPFGVPKGPQYVGRLLTEHALPMIGIMDTETHLRRRKSWGRGMTSTAIKEYEHFIAYRARQLMERLGERVGQGLVIGKWFDFFSFDFMSDMAFGGGSELIAAGHDEGNEWVILADAMFIATFFSHVPWLGALVGRIPAVAGNLGRLLNNSAKRAKQRLKNGSEKKDLFHYLNNEDLADQAAPPIQHLIDDGVLAIVAGADTTAMALTSLLYCILTHPDVYKNLQQEIDTFYPVGEDALDPKHYRDMPYLTAVINETLRVFPPAPSGTQRQVPQDSDGVIVGNIVLPPGTIFWAHAYSNHHDARNFSPYTSEFWPERWLLASGELSHSRGVTAVSPEFRHDEAGYLPFSIGPLNCVGKALALQELRMVACAMLQKFRVHMEAGWDPRKFDREYRDYLTSPRPSLPVTLELRS